MFGVMIHFDPI